MTDLVIRGAPWWTAAANGGDGAIRDGRARGVEWSLVSGQPVLERGHVVELPAGKRPGRVLRRFDA